MSNMVTFKRGTSFGSSVVFTPDGPPPALQNLIGVTVTSTIEDKCGTAFILTVVVAGNGLSFTANYPGDTSTWAIGTARWDVRFEIGGTVFYSDTMRLDVFGQVTV